MLNLTKKQQEVASLSLSLAGLAFVAANIIWSPDYAPENNVVANDIEGVVEVTGGNMPPTAEANGPSGADSFGMREAYEACQDCGSGNSSSNSGSSNGSGDYRGDNEGPGSAPNSGGSDGPSNSPSGSGNSSSNSGSSNGSGDYRGDNEGPGSAPNSGGSDGPSNSPSGAGNDVPGGASCKFC